MGPSELALLEEDAALETLDSLLALVWLLALLLLVLSVLLELALSLELLLWPGALEELPPLSESLPQAVKATASSAVASVGNR